jgi:hypothetical protein
MEEPVDVPEPLALITYNTAATIVTPWIKHSPEASLCFHLSAGHKNLIILFHRRFIRFVTFSFTSYMVTSTCCCCIPLRQVKCRHAISLENCV